MTEDSSNRINLKLQVGQVFLEFDELTDPNSLVVWQPGKEEISVRLIDLVTMLRGIGHV